MVVVMILGLIAMMIAISLPLSDASSALETHQRWYYQREANYQVARSAAELAFELLKIDDQDVDSGQDLWAFGNQRMNWEGRTLWLEIRDEESCFPINAVTSIASSNTTSAATNTTTSNTTASNSSSNNTNTAAPTAPGTVTPDQQIYLDCLQRLLERNGLPGREAVASLMDWSDSDDQVREGGAEQGSYPQIRVKNGPLDSIEELLLISRWGQPTLPPPIPLQAGQATLQEASKNKVPFEALNTVQPNQGANQSGAALANGSQWNDWVTLWSNQKVNLNTAPLEVLRCLDSRWNEATIQELINFRSRTALKTAEDLKKIPGIDQDLSFRLLKVSGFKSSHFRIRAIVDSQPGSTTSGQPGRLGLEAVVKREDNRKIRVLFWRVL
jgi:type II secretory pathway component PulK